MADLMTRDHSTTPSPADKVCATCGGRRSTSPEWVAQVRSALRPVGRVLAWPFIALIRVYQLVISPLTPPTCRYYPSCSSYALTALRRFGPLKGTWLAARRVLSCHPWAAGGVDYVPEAPHTCSCSGPSGPAALDKDRR